MSSHGIRRGLLINLGCPILCGREAINGLKGATEMVGAGETTGGGYLCDRERGLLAQQTGGILHTTSCDEGCQRSIVAALCKSGADAFLRQMETFHSSMPVEFGTEEKLFVDDDLAEVVEERGSPPYALRRK